MKIKKSVQNFSRNVNKNLQVIHEGKGTRAAARYAFKCAGRFFCTEPQMYGCIKNGKICILSGKEYGTPLVLQSSDCRMSG